MCIDGPVEPGKVIAERPCNELLPGEHPPGIGGEHAQETQLPRGDAHGNPCLADLPGSRVDKKVVVGKAQHLCQRRGVLRGAPEHRLHPRDELRGLKGFVT